MKKAKPVSIKAVARSAIAAEKKIGARKLGAVSKDSFENFAANVGVGPGSGNQSAAGTYGFNPISNDRSLLEWMYRGSWICRVAVEAVADDITRAGITIDSSMPPADAKKLQAKLKRWGVWAKINEAKKWARLYGGAIAVILIDGQDMSSPLRIETVGKNSFRGLRVFDRWMVNPSLGDIITELGPDLGNPRYYDVVATAPGLRNQRIHYSRCFRLEGVQLPFWQKLTLNYWGCSIFEPLYDRLLAFDSTTQGVAQLTYRCYQRTMKIKGLRKIIAAADSAYTALLKQVAMTRQFQTNEGITLLDGEDSLEIQSYTFAGLSDVLLQFAQQLSGATGIPLTRLFGQSPAGMNSTGESDLQNYDDNCSQEQELTLRNPLDVTLRVLAKSEGITLPDDFDYTFNPLRQLSAKEKAEIGEIDGRSAAALYTAQVIDRPTALKEVRQSAPISGRWSNVTDKEIKEAENDPPIPRGEEAETDEPGASSDHKLSLVK